MNEQTTRMQTPTMSHSTNMTADSRAVLLSLISASDLTEVLPQWEEVLTLMSNEDLTESKEDVSCVWENTWRIDFATYEILATTCQSYMLFGIIAHRLTCHFGVPFTDKQKHICLAFLMNLHYRIFDLLKSDNHSMLVACRLSNIAKRWSFDAASRVADILNVHKQPDPNTIAKTVFVDVMFDEILDCADEQLGDLQSISDKKIRFD